MLTVILIFIALQPGLWDVLLDAGRAIERAHGITGEPT